MIENTAAKLQAASGKLLADAAIMDGRDRQCNEPKISTGAVYATRAVRVRILIERETQSKISPPFWMLMFSEHTISIAFCETSSLHLYLLPNRNFVVLCEFTL